MTCDLVIRNGSIVDGSGAPAYPADIAAKAGKIVHIGTVTETALQTIDATGLIVAPGFIDPHSHYDAQICWDPYITPTSWHGVTTVVMGNCGVGLAPCRPEMREAITWDLINVESVPFKSIEEGVKWDWQTFPEYMDAAKHRGAAINLAFLVPLTPLRHWVMGEDSVERAANADESAEIAALLREAIEAGAFGFTTSIGGHVGHKGLPLGSTNASKQEVTAYANVLRELGRGAIEIALTSSPSRLKDHEYAYLDTLVRESGRPVTWSAVMLRDDEPEAHLEVMRQTESLARLGARAQITAMPITNELNLAKPLLFLGLPSMKPVFHQPKDVQKTVYRDPTFRAAFAIELTQGRRYISDWRRVAVKKATLPALKSLEGRRIADIAVERGIKPLDCFLDIALEDDLDTEFTIILYNVNDKRMPELICHPDTLIGLADGGAHIDMFTHADYTSDLIGKWVREKKVLSLEHAIQRLTSEPADFFGIHGRGRLRAGYAADVVIFDYETIGTKHHAETLHDFPGGAQRLVTRSTGIAYTMINGEILYDHGKLRNILPGRILRSGTSH